MEEGLEVLVGRELVMEEEDGRDINRQRWCLILLPVTGCSRTDVMC